MLRCLLVLLPVVGMAQSAENPGTEPIEVSGYRQKVVFTDPLVGGNSTSPAAGARYDTVVRKPEVRFDIPAPVADMQKRFIERNASLTEVPGFRVQVYAGSRDQAYRLDAELRSTYPQQRVTTFYDKVIFKVRLGDFTSRSDAEVFVRQLRQTYPAAFLVPDQVKPRRN